MAKKLHVIYIPGLGDENPGRQRMAVRTWRWWGVEAELIQMIWSDATPWEDKFERLLARIDALHAEGKSVGIVAASAGASAAINAYAVRKDAIVGVVLLAGKVNRPEAVGANYRQKFPSFIESLDACQPALASLSASERGNILSRYAVYDEIVDEADSIIPDAVNQKRYIPGHVPLIATQIIFGAPSFLRFLKSRGKIGNY